MGRSEQTLMVGDTTRRFVVEVGPSLSAPPPVVFMWHGFGGRVEVSRKAVEASRLWTDSILVVPVGLPRSFDAFGGISRPGWQTRKGEFGDRDLRFFDAMLDKLDELQCIDRTRVYTTGFSNGGFLSNVLACHRSEAIAAAAPTSGGGPFIEGCGDPVPVLVTHGSADRVVPHKSAEKTFAHWTAHNQCTANEPASPQGCTTAECPEGTEVQLCTIGRRHRWPDGQADRVAAFFRRHRKPSVDASGQ